MRMLMILLPMMFLSLNGCRSVTQKIICAQISDNEMKPLASGEISFQFSRCRARCLNPNTWAALKLKECTEAFPECKECNLDVAEYPNRKCEPFCEDLSKNYPLQRCEGIAGFFVEDIALEIRPKLSALNAIKKDYCN